jgi:RNA polymerase sigma-70 factor (ECF subfamily)
MHTTPVSLLQRLRQPAEPAAWERFVELYTPLLYFWARRRMGLPAEEAADLVQDVFALLLQKLPEFTYDQHKGFRAWLRTVMLNKWREHRRRRGVATVQAGDALADVAAPHCAGDLEEAEYRRHLVLRALQLMQAEFQPVTWKACWAYVVDGRAVEDVAAELGITTNAVYLAKSRVLRRLREEFAGLFN